jgi:hypothetical protein
MGEIRSALDIALEKTANIQGDAHSGENREFKNSGKKAAGDFLSSKDTTALAALLSGKTEEQSRLALEGAVSILTASIRLPVDAKDIASMENLGKGLGTLLPDAGMEQLFDQVKQIVTQYLQERAQIEKALETQFMPRLRAKQQELQKRYGQAVPMELHQDSEYVAAVNKNMRALEQKYESVITEVRSRVRAVAGIEE